MLFGAKDIFPLNLDLRYNQKNYEKDRKEKETTRKRERERALALGKQSIQSSNEEALRETTSH